MPLFFEEIKVGDVWTSDEYPVTKEEIVGFAKRWDPQPCHLDEAAAAGSIFGRLTASTHHLFAIMIFLVSRMEIEVAMLAGLGLTKFEIPKPVFPGDRLRLQRRVLSKHPSKTKPDRGVVRIAHLLIKQDDMIVVDSHHKLMIARKTELANE